MPGFYYPWPVNYATRTGVGPDHPLQHDSFPDLGDSEEPYPGHPSPHPEDFDEQLTTEWSDPDKPGWGTGGHPALGKFRPRGFHNPDADAFSFPDYEVVPDSTASWDDWMSGPWGDQDFYREMFQRGIPRSGALNTEAHRRLRNNTFHPSTSKTWGKSVRAPHWSDDGYHPSWKPEHPDYRSHSPKSSKPKSIWDDVRGIAHDLFGYSTEGDPMQYASDPAAREFLIAQPTGTHPLRIGADWLEELDVPHEDFEVDFRRAAADWLNERLGTPWQPPEVSDLGHSGFGDIFLDQGVPDPLYWPVMHPGQPDAHFITTMRPRINPTGPGVDPNNPRPEDFWWGEMLDFPARAPERWNIHDRDALAQNHNEFHLHDLTPVEHAYAGITPLGDVTGEQWAGVLDLMRRRKRELGHFSEDDTPMNYAAPDWHAHSNYDTGQLFYAAPRKVPAGFEDRADFERYVRELVRFGASANQIAQMVGVAHPTIDKIARTVLKNLIPGTVAHPIPWLQEPHKEIEKRQQLADRERNWTTGEWVHPFPPSMLRGHSPPDLAFDRDRYDQIVADVAAGATHEEAAEPHERSKETARQDIHGLRRGALGGTERPTLDQIRRRIHEQEGVPILPIQSESSVLARGDDPTDYNLADQRAFEHHISQNPTDDTLRGVYADWLDEHGDWREAEYQRNEAVSEHISDMLRGAVGRHLGFYPPDEAPTGYADEDFPIGHDWGSFWEDPAQRDVTGIAFPPRFHEVPHIHPGMIPGSFWEEPEPRGESFPVDLYEYHAEPTDYASADDFLSAIEEEPNEILHRIALIDWLQEQGEEPREAHRTAVLTNPQRAVKVNAWPSRGGYGLFGTSSYVPHLTSKQNWIWRLAGRHGGATSGRRITNPMRARARDFSDLSGWPYWEGAAHNYPMDADDWAALGWPDFTQYYEYGPDAMVYAQSGEPQNPTYDSYDPQFVDPGANGAIWDGPTGYSTAYADPGTPDYESARQRLWELIHNAKRGDLSHSLQDVLDLEGIIGEGEAEHMRQQANNSLKRWRSPGGEVPPMPPPDQLGHLPSEATYGQRLRAGRSAMPPDQAAEMIRQHLTQGELTRKDLRRRSELSKAAFDAAVAHGHRQGWFTSRAGERAPGARGPLPEYWSLRQQEGEEQLINPDHPTEYATGPDAERMSFETALAANPWDGAGHGVYADWLDEQGNTWEAAARRRVAQSVQGNHTNPVVRAFMRARTPSGERVRRSEYPNALMDYLSERVFPNGPERPQIPPPQPIPPDFSEYSRTAYDLVPQFAEHPHLLWEPPASELLPLVDRLRQEARMGQNQGEEEPLDYATGPEGERLGFETSLAGAPLDHTAHRVYADWLDENGYPWEAWQRRALASYLQSHSPFEGLGLDHQSQVIDQILGMDLAGEWNESPRPARPRTPIAQLVPPDFSEYSRLNYDAVPQFAWHAGGPTPQFADNPHLLLHPFNAQGLNLVDRLRFMAQMAAQREMQHRAVQQPLEYAGANEHDALLRGIHRDDPFELTGHKALLDWYTENEPTETGNAAFRGDLIDWLGTRLGRGPFRTGGDAVPFVPPSTEWEEADTISPIPGQEPFVIPDEWLVQPLDLRSDWRNFNLWGTSGSGERQQTRLRQPLRRWAGEPNERIEWRMVHNLPSTSRSTALPGAPHWGHPGEVPPHARDEAQTATDRRWQWEDINAELGTHPDSMNDRPWELMPQERALIGLDELGNLPKPLYPHLENLLRQRWDRLRARGHAERLESSASPTNYANHSHADFLRHIYGIVRREQADTRIPKDTLPHRVYADYLQDEGLDEHAAQLHSIGLIDDAALAKAEAAIERLHTTFHADETEENDRSHFLLHDAINSVRPDLGRRTGEWSLTLPPDVAQEHPVPASRYAFSGGESGPSEMAHDEQPPRPPWYPQDDSPWNQEIGQSLETHYSTTDGYSRAQDHGGFEHWLNEQGLSLTGCAPQDYCNYFDNVPFVTYDSATQGRVPVPYSATPSSLIGLFRAARENPYENTHHGVIADALDEAYPDNHISGLLRRQFGFGEHAEAGPQDYLWYEPVENAWDGTFPYRAHLGTHGPFDIYLGHEGGPQQSRAWIVHAVAQMNRNRELNDFGYTFEFPHERAHEIPRMFPEAEDYISPVLHPPANEALLRPAEAEMFDARMDQQERDRE